MKTDLFDAWKEYESIAMHFNDLLIRLRTQAVGGLAALISLSAVLGKTAEDESFNWAFLSAYVFLLMILWVAVWILDFKYYNKLLMGAVEELMRIEELSKTSDVLDYINLSTAIAEAERGKSLQNIAIKGISQTLGRGRWMFYILVFLGLLGIFITSICMQ